MSPLDLSFLAGIGKPLAQSFREWEEVQGELVKVQDNLFAVLDDEDEGGRGKTQIHGFLWAVSTGAALRAWFNDIEADDGASLLCGATEVSTPKPYTYSAILLDLKDSDRPYIESASYRIMSDGKLVHKSIQTKGKTFFFRSREIDAMEPVYAVLHTIA